MVAKFASVCFKLFLKSLSSSSLSDTIEGLKDQKNKLIQGVSKDFD